MKQYLDALKLVLDQGDDTTDRTGVGTRSYFGMQMRYSLKDGLPLVTTKKLHLRSIIHELLWFLSGDTNIAYLKQNGVSIWDEWADENGELGPVYGRQWRDWGRSADDDKHAPNRASRNGLKRPGGIDQIRNLLDLIESSPDSRRMIVSAWNPADLEIMALPPCHTMWQVKINGGKMHLQLYQRSGDMFLGVPFNIASYALLLEMIAHVTGYEAGDFIHTIGDAHIYSNHMDQVHLQLQRRPHPLPRLRFAREVRDLFDFRYEDIIIDDYVSDPRIPAPVAV